MPRHSFPENYTVTERLKALAAELSGREMRSIYCNETPEDLGLDSLDVVEFIMEVEREFNVALDDVDAIPAFDRHGLINGSIYLLSNPR